jgi:hypothetical protein
MLYEVNLPSWRKSADEDCEYLEHARLEVSVQLRRLPGSAYFGYGLRGQPVDTLAVPEPATERLARRGAEELFRVELARVVGLRAPRPEVLLALAASLRDVDRMFAANAILAAIGGMRQR